MPPGRTLLLTVGFTTALSCTESPPEALYSPPSASPVSDAPGHPVPSAPPNTPPQLDGHAFPDHVLALTWDDGPDRGTLELAKYLRSEGVAATFFTVGEWIAGLSSDPGSGSHVFDTGYEHIAVLDDLVRLGHRLGNHTLNHVILYGNGGDMADYQLREGQEKLDPYITNELPLFRLPGGVWDEAAANAVESDPYLKQLVGPIRWDVDDKDWRGSLACDSTRPSLECEGPAGARRLKPAIVAQRYLAAIDAHGRGIVLLHDRVGHVGSRYALDVARHLVPELRARGYVFTAPVLSFSPTVVRFAAGPGERLEGLFMTDVNGDGRADLCEQGARGLECATSIELGTGHRPRTMFSPLRPWDAARGAPPEGPAPPVVDLNDDGRADLCRWTRAGIACALSTGRGLALPERWSASGDFNDLDSLRMGDLNGDGRTDLCARERDGIYCALSTGRSFTRASRWLPSTLSGMALELADINGDGRADLCGIGASDIVCGLAP